MRDVFNFRIAEQYNADKFNGILDITSNIGDEMSIKNMDYDHKTNPGVPKRLYYYPIKVGIKNYLLDSTKIDMLPVKILATSKMTVASKGYHRIDNMVSVRIKDEKTMEYREFINNYLPYEHIEPKEWLVWKIICERAIAETFYLRAMSYPSWGKTSTFYVKGMLRNDIEILDNSTYAKMKYSLSVQPRVLVLDEVDDIDTDTKRSLSKIFRNAGGGMGNLGNDSRAVSGTLEKFDLSKTSIVALYNFPTEVNSKFFDSNFHEKISSRLFPVLLNGGNNDKSPLLHVHEKIKEPITDDERNILDNFLRTSRHYELHWLKELKESGKDKWSCKHKYNSTRHQQTYMSICNGLKLYAETIEEFHRLEDVVYKMNQNYYQFKDMLALGDVEWHLKQKPKATKQESLIEVEEEML